MNNIHKFPTRNLRKEIREGHISDGTRELIRQVLIELCERHPNSWDKRFCEDMLTYRKKLSIDQSKQLERVLYSALTKSEPPSMRPKFKFIEESSKSGDFPVE